MVHVSTHIEENPDTLPRMTHSSTQGPVLTEVCYWSFLSWVSVPTKSQMSVLVPDVLSVQGFDQWSVLLDEGLTSIFPDLSSMSWKGPRRHPGFNRQVGRFSVYPKKTVEGTVRPSESPVTTLLYLHSMSRQSPVFLYWFQSSGQWDQRNHLLKPPSWLWFTSTSVQTSLWPSKDPNLGPGVSRSDGRFVTRRESFIERN